MHQLGNEISKEKKAEIKTILTTKTLGFIIYHDITLAPGERVIFFSNYNRFFQKCML